MSTELDAMQQKAVNELGNGKILNGPVGVGKSRVAAAYYIAREAPKDVYVITTAKKRSSLDWQKEFVAYGIGTSADATTGGVLTVDSWNSIKRYVNVENAFFIFDEQRVVGSGSWARAFVAIAKKNRWILLTATPGDTWLDYIPVFVANGFYKNRSRFIEEHVVYNTYTKFPKVDRYIGTGKLIKHRDAIMVEMSYVRHTVRNSETILVHHDADLFARVWEKRWNIYEDRPLRDVSEMCRVARRLVNSDPSRIASVRKKLETQKRLIVFYNFDYELETLRGLNQDTKVAEWNGHNHQDIPVENSWVYLVQYVAGSEGWNCISTNSTLFYSLTYSYKNWHQAHGRTDRRNTPFTELEYTILRSSSVMDNMIWNSLLHKQSFNERKIKWEEAA